MYHEIAQSNKFQATVIESNKNIADKYPLKTVSGQRGSSSLVTLLGIEIDNKLNFEKHFSTFSEKTSNQ